MGGVGVGGIVESSSFFCGGVGVEGKNWFLGFDNVVLLWGKNTC